MGSCATPGQPANKLLGAHVVDIVMFGATAGVQQAVPDCHGA